MPIEEEVIIRARLEEKPKNAASKMKGTFLQLRRAMISLMLAGYGLQKAMFGLLRSSFDMVGIFDMLNVTLGIVFLPIALALLDALLPIMLFFIDLPEPVQKAIGAFVLIAGILGALLGLFGAIGAATTGLTPVLAILGVVFEALGAALVTAGAIIGVVFGIIVALIIGFVSAWQTNFANIQGWVDSWFGGIIKAFQGMIDIFKGLFTFWVGLFSGNANKMIEGLKTAISGLKEFVSGIGQMLWSLLVIISISLLKFFVNIIKAGWDFGVKIVTGIIDGIKSIGYKILETLLSFLPESLRTSIGGFLGMDTPSKSSNTSGSYAGASSNPYNANISNSLQVTVVAPNDYSVNVRNGVSTP